MLGSIDVDGRSINSPQERRLLAVLLLHRGRTVPVSAVMEAIWGDEIPSAGRASLQSKVSRLRAVVGQNRIEHGPGGYRINIDPGEYDADEFESLALRMTHQIDPIHRLALADEALLLWHGPLCGELADEEFVGGESVRLEQLRGSVAEAKAAALIETGRFDEALADLELLARDQPYHDRLCELRMTALARMGRVVDALRCFSDYQKRLIEDVGVVPTQPLIDLERRILQGDLGSSAPIALRDERNDVPTGATRFATPGTEYPARAPVLRGNRWNAPIIMRPPFVGREEAVATIRRSLLRGDAPRCCFVSGEGGIGKTRLAIEAMTINRRVGRSSVLIQCRRPPTSLFAPFDQSSPSETVAWNEPSARDRLVASRVHELRSRLGTGSLLVVEDLHWADEGTLAVLSSLAAMVSLEDQDVAWLLTSRPMAPGTRQAEEIDRLLRELPTTTIHLDGLTEPETFQLIRRAADASPKLRLIDLLHRRTGGNPLLTLTGLQSLRSSGDLRWDGRTLSSAAHAFRSVPSELIGSLDHVVAKLDPIARRLLQDLALMGGMASLESLPALPDTDPLALIEAVGAAEVAGLVELSDESVRFSHDLYCRVVEEGIPSAERSERHHLAYLKLLPPGGDLSADLSLWPTTRLLQLAHHASGAGHLVPRAETLAVFLANAYRALGETDWSTAARYYRLSRDLARDCAVDQRDRLYMDAYAGAALFRVHDATEAVPLLEDVIARAADGPELDVWAQALADHGRATVFLSRVVPRPDMGGTERFIRAASKSRPSDCARLLALGAEQLFSVGDNLGARELIDRARAIAPLDASALLRAELAFADGLTWLGELRLAEADDQFQRCIVHARAAGSTWVLSWGLGRRAFIKVISAEIEEADALLREARATQFEAGSWSELSFTATLEAHISDLRGDAPATDGLIAQSERLLLRSGYAFTAQFLYPLMMQRAAKAGDTAGCADAAARWAEFANRIPRIFRVLNLAIAGEWARAESELAGWKPLAQGPFGPGHLTLIAAQHRCASILGDSALREATETALDALGEKGIRLLPGTEIDVGLPL